MFGFGRKVTAATRFNERPPPPPSLADGASRFDAVAKSLTTGLITHVESGSAIRASERMMAVGPSEA